MAQSGLKKKSTSKFVLPSQKSGKSSNKSRKGVVKKGKSKETSKVKQNLQKAIGRKIEEELVTVATDKGNNFKILNAGGRKKNKKAKTK